MILLLKSYTFQKKKYVSTNLRYMILTVFVGVTAAIQRIYPSARLSLRSTVTLYIHHDDHVINSCQEILTIYKGCKLF